MKKNTYFKKIAPTCTLSAFMFLLFLLVPDLAIASNPDNGTMRSIQTFGVRPENTPEVNREKLQAAIDWASASGSALYVTPVEGGYRVATGLILRKNVSLIGAHGPTGRGTQNPQRNAPTGSLFVITDTEQPFITVESATQIRGIQFWYPEQSHRKAADIIPYKPTIQMAKTGNVQGVTLTSLTFYGEYMAMDFRSKDNICEQILIEHCYGYPLGGEFIAIDKCYDIPRILHCHVNPANMREFGRTFSKEVIDRVIAQKTFTFWINHTDNAQLIDVFTFGAYGGVYLGAESYGQLTNFNLDCVTIGIYKSGTNTKNRNWQIAQGSIIANVGEKITDIHPIVIEGKGHTALTNVEAFSGDNAALTTLSASYDFLTINGNETLTVSLFGCRMQGYTADNPITINNPNARIRAVACIDKDEQFFDLKPDAIALFDLKYTLPYDLTDRVQVLSLWDDIHTVSTLQGVVNRNRPQLFINYVVESGIEIDGYWWNKYRQPGEWLHGRDTVVYDDIVNLVNVFKSSVKGAVVYDSDVASTSNVASAVAGIENLVAVRYDPAPNSLYTRLIAGGPRLEVKVWLIRPDGTSLFDGKGQIPDTNRASTGSVKNDPYIWFIEKYMKTGRCNGAFGAYYIDQKWRENPRATVVNHHTLTNHDFFVSKRAFFFDLSPWGDEPATDDPTQAVGTDLATLKEFLLEAYRLNQGVENRKGLAGAVVSGNKGAAGLAGATASSSQDALMRSADAKICYIGGFPAWAFKYTKHAGGRHEDVPTEWEFSRIISAYNAFKDADAIGYGALANASFWHHFPLDETYPQHWVTQDELKKRGYLTPDGKVDFNNREFMIFYVGDYDASSWITQRTPTIWEHPDRGKLPLMWSVSPVLQERAPMVMHHFRRTATPNDYFAAADNGAGYLMPGMLQEPRAISGLPSGLDAWANHCKPYYDRWGLTITGFVIDGEAPGLSNEGLDCYASFSPNGIVPQKVPLTLLHGNMPVLRSGEDIQQNPKEAAQRIAQRVIDRPIPFHWFRNILKTPGWYVEVMDELGRINPKIELLDAPTFFELYRIWLQQNPDAANGAATAAT